MEALRELYDFRQLTLPEALFTLSWDKNAVEQAVDNLRTRFLTIEEVQDAVQLQDFALIFLPAQGEQKEKTVVVNVGKHFYNAPFEDSLVGLKAGAEVTMPRRDGGRTGTLVSVKRRIRPALSDELAARMHLEGIATVEEYREREKRLSIEGDKEKKLRALLGLVKKEAMKRSVFAPLEALVEEQLEAYVRDLRMVAEMNGFGYEEFLAMNTPEQYDTMDKRVAYWREKAEGDIKLKAIADAFVKAEGVTFTEKDYEEKCREYLSRGASQEQVDRYTFEMFLEGAPVEYYEKCIAQYFEPRFHVAEPA